MNNDLISREALKKAIETCDKFACLSDTKLVPFRMLNEPEKDYEPYVHLRDIRNAIDNAPTVLHDNYSMGYQDGIRKVLSERPTGKWIMITEPDGFMHSKCSNCNQFNAWGDVPFCPWCGEKMERSEEE